MPIRECFTHESALISRAHGKFTAEIYASVHQQADGLQNHEL